MLHSICQQIWKTQQWPQNWKRSVFILIPKKSSAKECSNYHTMTLISMPARFWSKSFKLGFSSTWTENSQMDKLGLEKAEESKIKLPTSAGSLEKQEFQKNIYFCFTDYTKAVWIITKSRKFLKRWECQTTLPASYETCIQIKKQQNQTWNNGLVQNWERSMTRLYIATLLI